MVRNMFRTGFLVRATHTVLTWVITLILFVHNTDLRQCEERGELTVPVLFFLLVVLSVLLYFAVSLMDPGFVLTDTVKPSDLESESMMPQSSTCRLRRCGFCLLQVGHFSQCHVGGVAPRQWLPVGGAVRGGRVLGGGVGAAGLPRLPGGHQLHHVGVHVPPPYRVPEGARRRRQPLRPRRPLQPVGLLLRVRRRDLGAGLPPEPPESRLSALKF
ncbi:uncharacterized protein LOC144048593 isoform X2 [Vanacampus margaritifer]